MAHQVPWNNTIIEEFVKLALLSETEEYIIRSRAYGTTITAQAEYLHMSIDNVKKIIARLKKKYDLVQKESTILPPRKFSSQETYMDTH